MRIYQSSRNLLRLGYILYTKGTKMISFTKFKFGKYFIIFQTLFQLVRRRVKGFIWEKTSWSRIGLQPIEHGLSKKKSRRMWKQNSLIFSASMQSVNTLKHQSRYHLQHRVAALLLREEGSERMLCAMAQMRFMQDNQSTERTAYPLRARLNDVRLR